MHILIIYLFIITTVLHCLLAIHTVCIHVHKINIWHFLSTYIQSCLVASTRRQHAWLESPAEYLHILKFIFHASLLLRTTHEKTFRTRPVYEHKWVSYGASDKGTEPLCIWQLAGDKPGEIRAWRKPAGSERHGALKVTSSLWRMLLRSLCQISQKPQWIRVHMFTPEDVAYGK